MKQILLFLSITFFLGCSSDQSETKDELEDLMDPVFELVDKLLKENVDLSTSLNDLIVKIDTTDNGIQAHGLENHIDPGKILFITADEKALHPFTEEMNTKIGSPKSFGTYTVWLYRKLEFSLFPNPTEEWVFMIRKR